MKNEKDRITAELICETETGINNRTEPPSRCIVGHGPNTTRLKKENKAFSKKIETEITPNIKEKEKILKEKNDERIEENKKLIEKNKPKIDELNTEIFKLKKQRREAENKAPLNRKNSIEEDEKSMYSIKGTYVQ